MGEHDHGREDQQRKQHVLDAISQSLLHSRRSPYSTTSLVLDGTTTHGHPRAWQSKARPTPLPKAPSYKEPASPKGSGLNQATMGGADALLLGVAVLGYVTIHELVQQLVE